VPTRSKSLRARPRAPRADPVGGATAPPPTDAGTMESTAPLAQPLTPSRSGLFASPYAAAVRLAAVLIVGLLAVVTLWNLGWLGIDKPTLPPTGSQSSQVITTRRPTFDGKLTSGTSATFSLSPPVAVRWTVEAQDAGTRAYSTRVPVGLPKGSYQMTVDGEPVGTLTVNTDGNQPRLDGVLPDGKTESTFRLSPAVTLRWQVEASAPDGTYHTVAPVPIPPGPYTLSVNGSPVEQFTIADNAT